tara:strand:+ start:181 stop:288 length:108 start_codon:yes stop_codon:yes gene_type:complete
MQIINNKNKQELKDIAKITFFKVIGIYLNFIELLI